MTMRRGKAVAIQASPLLLLLALLLKVSVPSGWMWSGEGFGWKPCASAQGSRTVGSEMPGQHGAHGGTGEHEGAAPEQPCVFAAVPILAGGDPFAEVRLPLSALAAASPVLARSWRRLPLASAPPPATGPPAIV